MRRLVVGDVGQRGGDLRGFRRIGLRRAGRVLGRDSGACRSAIRPTACQPKKRLTRSRITADWCWISIAAGPSTRSTSVAGSDCLAVRRARPLQLDRLGIGRDLGADDVLPARHQLGRGEALLLERVRQELGGEFGKLAGGAAGLVHGLRLCQIGRMKLAAAAVRKEARGTNRCGRADPAALLAWYDRHRRHLPWRAPPGERADPYHVWLSEIMLQQTTVKAVGPYYANSWRAGRTCGRSRSAARRRAEGLGRARLLRPRAQPARLRAGRGRASTAADFPDTEDGLRALPGIGGYTAAAIAAIAFDRRAVAIDGNIERVIARLYAIEAELPAAKAEIRARADALVPPRRSGDFTQALMDLGATICTPKKPACGICPWMGPAWRARAATPRPFRARRRRSRASCGTARPSSSRAPTVMCWCARGRRRACLAA